MQFILLTTEFKISVNNINNNIPITSNNFKIYFPYKIKINLKNNSG